MKYKWMPVITEDCNGCGACVDACGPKSLAITDGGVAALVAPETCGSEEHCIGICPVDAIHMEWLAHRGDESRGQWRE